MGKGSGKSVQYPDLKPVDPELQQEQFAAMKGAVAERGGLSEGEDLTAYPAGSDPPGGTWKKAGTYRPEGGTSAWDVYTRRPDTLTMPELAITLGKPPAGTVPGEDSLKDVADKNFSPPLRLTTLRSIVSLRSPRALSRAQLLAM